MCGIAGYFGKKEITDQRISDCFSAMKRRGPDSSGSYIHKSESKNSIYLFHSRLSIIDCCSRSNQPYRSGSKIGIYNGELYNYRELKQDMIDDGIKFDTESDTEVLMKILEIQGVKGLDCCEGMWAFAVYDIEKGSLLLSRDRFGEKPLYLYQDAEGLFFASEIKFIFALLGSNLPINFDHIYRYLINGYQSLYKKNHCFFKGIKELSGATCLSISPDSVHEQKKYWKPQYIPDDSMTYQNAVEGVRELLINSVKMRLRSDVPLAFCLSGGVDSNSLISIASRILSYDVHGYTVINSDKRYDEQKMVAHSVKELNIKHTEIPVSKINFISDLTNLINYHDSPVSTITYFAHWQMLKAIAEDGYKIAVSGSGADELFSGYYDHHLAYLSQMYKADATLFKKALSNWEKYIKPLVRNPILKTHDLFVKNPAFRNYVFCDAKELNNYLNNKWYEPFEEEKYSQDLLFNRMANELFHENVPVILHEEDLNSMFCSVENRSPFLDRKLFDFSATIPVEHLIRDGRAKAVLRDAMKDIAPTKIIRKREKTGFNAPIESYLDVKGEKCFLLADSPVFDHINRNEIKTLIQKDRFTNDESKFLFAFLNTKIFLEEYSG